MIKLSTSINKALYAVVFLIAVPALLWIWAKHTEDLINWPVIESAPFGWTFLVSGIVFMLWAMYYLYTHGKGLPMNAYPPSKHVSTGPYLLFRHPIYLGFILVIIGFFIITKSSSGLWLVTPFTILGIMALVLGYERIDLKKRFPNEYHETLIDLPVNAKEPVTLRERLASLYWVGLSLIVSNFILIKLLSPISPIYGYPLTVPFNFDFHYSNFLALVFVAVVPFIINRKDILTNWATISLVAITFSMYTSLLYPEIVAQYFSRLNPNIFTVPVFLILISARSLFVQSKNLGIPFTLLAIVLTALQLRASPSAELHLGSSILIFLLASNYLPIWLFLKNTAQSIANSWKEWVFGKVRVINHGFYVGFGAFIGIIIAGTLVGDAYAWALLVFSIVVILFSAFWAQLIEGSEKLKRPYGYYGALVGIVFASFVVWTMGFNVWIVIGVISVVMPWVQAIGRLRCLINGCCHGSKVDDPNIGIRYFHFRSRVCGISNLKGELVHPTPLYSILWLFLVGFVLLALWQNGFQPPFIFGLYLMLNGLGRFVEEAYRGEVQTPILKGLRLYQWTAILSVLIGIIMTFIRIDPITVVPNVGWQTLVSAFIGGLFTTFAMGVDFPNSNARFSRLV